MFCKFKMHYDFLKVIDSLVSLDLQCLHPLVSSKWVVIGLNTGDHLHLFEAPAAANEACKLCCYCEEEWRLMTNRPICTSRNWSDLKYPLTDADGTIISRLYNLYNANMR